MLIIGLGNPGEKYNHTRHNIGFMALDNLAKELDLNWKEEKKFKSQIAKSPNIILAKPQTFMNLSGEAVQKIIAFFNIKPEDILIIHDDLDIEFGKYKTSKNSRAAGHNGVQDIINKLNTKNFIRIRVGIKPQLDNQVPIEKYVLQKFSKEEFSTVNQIIKNLTEDIIKK